MFYWISDLFWLLIIALFGAKWYITGVLGRDIGQIFLVVCLFTYIYIGIIRMIKNKRVLRQSSLIVEHSDISRRENQINYLHVVLLFAYVVIVIISLFRSMNAVESLSFVNVVGRVLTLFIFIAICSFAIIFYINSRRADKLWQTLLFSLGIYMFINVLGWVFSIQNSFVEGLDLSRTDTIFSFWQTRASFPFAANHQALSIEAGMFIFVALVGFSYFRRKQLLTVFIMVAVIVIIAANSRTPILGILLGGVIIFCWRLGGKRLVFPVFIIVLLIPLIFSFIDIQSLLSQINLDLVAFTRKKDITELATLNNRVLIWSTILNKYGGFEAIHLVGYGAFGHISSGISYIYAQYWRDPELITLHNAYLQHLIDDGYIGFFVFIALLWNAIRVSLNQLSNGNLAFLYPFAVLIYLVVCSTLDVTIYFNQNVSFLFFLLANFQVAFGEKKLLEKHNGELLPEPI